MASLTPEVRKLLNRQTFKALLILSKDNIIIKITLSDIIKQIKKQIPQVKDIIVSTEYVRESLDKLNEIGLVEITGRSKYSLVMCEDEKMPLPQQPTPKPPIPLPVKSDPSIFKSRPPKRCLPENSSNIDPNRKQRRPEEVSSSSLSGDDIDKRRKIFHGKKKIRKIESNVNLPGARQVKSQSENLNEENIMEETNSANTNLPQCSHSNSRTTATEVLSILPFGIEGVSDTLRTYIQSLRNRYENDTENSDQIEDAAESASGKRRNG